MIRQQKKFFLATIFIFLIHGCWDAMLSLIDFFAKTTKFSNADLIGGTLLVITIVFGITYIVISIIKIIKVLKNNKLNKKYSN